jgi:hypothetical protein
MANKPKTGKSETAGKKSRRKPLSGRDGPEKIDIKPRRKVETSDALMFPSGRPIRKR